MKNLPKCFNQVKKVWRWKETKLPIIYFINYYHSGVWKYESGSSSNSSSKSSVTVFSLSCPYMMRKCYHSLTSNILCLDFGQYWKFTAPFWWSKLKNSWSACARIRKKTTTTDFWQGACIQRTKGCDGFAWSTQHRCNNLGIVLSGLDLKHWLTNSKGTHWRTNWDISYRQWRNITW